MPLPTPPKFGSITPVASHKVEPPSKFNTKFGSLTDYYGPETEKALTTPVLPDIKQPTTWLGGFGKSLYDDYIKPLSTPRSMIQMAGLGKAAGDSFGSSGLNEVKSIANKISIPENLIVREIDGSKVGKGVRIKSVNEGSKVKGVVLGDVDKTGPVKFGKLSEPRNVSNINVTRFQGVVDTPDPVKRLVNAIDESGPIRSSQEKLYTAERGRRISKLEEIGKSTSGEEGFKQELGALSGELPKAQFEPIRDRLSQKHIDDVFDIVKDHPKLSSWEKITARRGLAKLFGEAGGSVPQEGELALLDRVFGPELSQSVLAKRSLGSKAWDGTKELLNIPRSIMASIDLSAPFRQGAFMAGRKEFWTSFDDMFKSLGSEKGYKAVMDSISAKPSFNLAMENGLQITDLSRLAKREESFMSNWAEKIPVLGPGIRASGRAYGGFLNKLRADVYDDLAKKLDAANNPEVAKGLADYINTATGRGKLGAFEKSAQGVNSILFSPRLLSSRVSLLTKPFDPRTYTKLPVEIRKEYFKDLFKTAGAATTLLGLAKAGGAEVNIDPRNSDFGKIKIGNTRIDMLAGFQQPVVAATRFMTGKEVSPNTGRTTDLTKGKFGQGDRMDLAYRFLESKETPIGSFITGLARGKNYVGDKFEMTPEIINRLTPMMISDLVSLYKESPEEFPFLAPLAPFVPVNTFSKKSSYR